MYRFSIPTSLTQAASWLKAWNDRERSLQGLDLKVPLAALEIFAFYVMARYLQLLSLHLSIAEHVNFEFQFLQRLTAWGAVVSIDITSSLKAPHIAGLYVVFASDRSVQ